MNNIKIAAVTNDGVTITGHFGMAQYYQVVLIEAGKITSKEQRLKPHHDVHPDYAHDGLRWRIRKFRNT